MRASQPPKRPGFGSIGSKLVVRANHFLVQAADLEFYHYDVAIVPDVAIKKYSRDIIIQLVRLNRPSLLGNRLAAYDGRKNLYTAGPLPFPTSKEFVVNLPKSGSTSKELVFTVTLKLVAKVGLEPLKEFLAGRSLDSPQDTIQALDVVLRSTQSLNRFTLVGSSFFSKEMGNGPLDKGIEYWKGFYQSIRPTQMGLSLNIDVSATAFYEEMPVPTFVELQLGRELTPTSKLGDRDHLKLKRALKGLMIQTTHGSQRNYKVNGLSTVPSNKEMFSSKEGDKISVAQYFSQEYGIRLKYPFLPCLHCGSSKRPASLPMEVCIILGGQKYSKKLDMNQVTALLRAACQRPHVRESTIKEVVKGANYNADELVNREFQLHLDDKLATIEARVLPPPMLNYGDNMSVAPKLGAWNMIDKRMYEGGSIGFWRCINFSRSDAGRVEQFCYELAAMCKKKGMNFTQNPTHRACTFPPENVETALEQVYANSMSERRPIELLLIILPDGDSQYGKIKRTCETKLGIVSQCCKPKHLWKISPQYLENVALKINVKAGGCNTVLKDAANRKIPLVTDVSTIIFGADVTHPQPGEDSGPSIAAVVASMDFPGITKYKVLISAQSHREEIIKDLATMVRELLESFMKVNRQLPGRIIFYRDGVGDGQFAEVLLHEMDAIRRACQSLRAGYLPRVTFIVVQKRHHTRLFPADPKMQDRNGNVLPGIVVDTQICHPSQYDFFLCSHAGIQGTNRPAHYHVLFDENCFAPDLLQLFTNSLCYTFARCTRSVSVVPPAYYAHLAAFRARYYIEGDGSDAGSTRSGGRTRDANADVQFVLPAIKNNVQEVMFYC